MPHGRHGKRTKKIANTHTLFGFINVSATAAPYVVILLYSIAGSFLTMAWFFHLKLPADWKWWAYIAVSWGFFALFEYIFANQATRLGHLGGYFTVGQLKTIQITTAIIAYLIFSYIALNEKITIYHISGFGLIALGAGLVFTAPK